MSSGLFSEFEKVSAKQWKQKVQVDLKGADFNETLVWNSADGVDVKPFYHPEETAAPFSINSSNGWHIGEKIYAGVPHKANETARTALEKGAESLWFVLPSEELDLEVLLKELDLKSIPVHLDCLFLSEEFLQKLKKFIGDSENNIFLHTDIIGKLARTGNWFHNLKKDHDLLDSYINTGDQFTSVVSINTSLYQNAGANIPQQLAYGLAHANEYLNHLENSSSNSNKQQLLLTFEVSVGSNYFFEIAKLRALRLLYASLAKEYGFLEECHIIATPSKRNKTIYDYNVNLLRTTTECMSAVLGGADTVSNIPYDMLYHKTNEFGARIARNQLLILKNESYFEKVGNPAEGSYYIETLTQQFAEKALAIFKEIEKGGGFLKQLKEGLIQKKITESGKKEFDSFEQGEIVLVGTNKYANPADKMKPELELYPFLKKNPRKTLLEPILERRLAEKQERERLEKEGEKDKEGN